MAEFSGLWSTGMGSGDSQVSYTQLQDSLRSQVMAACNGFEGVAPGYLNSLAGTVTGANAVQIDTGGALVDGKYYNNSAAVSVNIPSTVTYTRIDRIVLRANWAAYTVRIYRIAGTEASSPTPPAIVQTPGTTYDIKLVQALVNTSGTVTLTDERILTQVQTAGIANSAVTTAKITDANVTYAKLAIYASKVTNRQGGNSGNWSTPGTTNFTPTGVRFECGSATIGAGSTANIYFGSLFSGEPLVFVIIISASGFTQVIPSYDHFVVATYDHNGIALPNVTIFWLAIGY